LLKTRESVHMHVRPTNSDGLARDGLVGYCLLPHSGAVSTRGTTSRTPLPAGREIHF
jgi:hypothetical protein